LTKVRSVCLMSLQIRQLIQHQAFTIVSDCGATAM